MPRILVLNDTRDQPNWGSVACAQTLIDIIEASVPTAEVATYTASWMLRSEYERSLPRGPRPVQRIVPRRFHRRIQEHFLRVPYVVDEFDHVADVWLSGLGGVGADEFIRDLAHADAVVFNAEGSTYRANRAAVLAMFMLWFARTRFGVPATFLNGTVALTNIDRILPGMVRKTFEVLDGIAVREPVSGRNVEQYVPGARAEVVPDSVFALSPDSFVTTPALRDFLAPFGGDPYLVVSSSMLPIDFFGSRAQSSLVHLIGQLAKIVPNVVLTAKDVGDQWLQDVAALTNARFFGPDFSYQELAALLGSAQVLVSGRYHNIILGAIVGCPAVPFTTTSPKIDGLCELMDGLIGDPFDVTDLWSSMDEIVDRASAQIDAGQQRREELITLSARHRQATQRLGDIVRGVLAVRQ